jgi:DNA polymerase-3 subunit alpha
MSDFVHLHCHTEYSLLDGAIRIKDLCDKAKDFGMPAAAITDHGNMFGALAFYLAAQKIGIKPILGCEVYVAVTSHDDRSSPQARERRHLVLLAQNLEGYHNLVKLVSAGHLNGFYHKPRVDKEMLSRHGEGLIALSACLAGEIPRKLAREGMDAAIASAKEYARIFPNRFYIELQSNGLKEQEIANTQLIELAEHLDLPLVATNDCHYLTAQDVEAHDILLCIQTAACVDDKQRMRFDTKELYYKSPEEMEAAFRHVPEAIANTARIAEACDVTLNLKDYHFPTYALPEGKTLQEEFADLSRRGLDARLAKMPATLDRELYRGRLEHELAVIQDMGFAGYFLIVQDFINWAKAQSIPVGPGRGSAAGSLVAWALRITNLDPIPYNLLFERFLNSERVSMPDIDVDFCERRRTEVIEYVSHKYGQGSVAQITTFGKMKAKAVLRDVARALGMSFGDADKIAKLIPTDDLKITLAKALEREPELKALYETDPAVKRLIDISLRLEGLCRHASTHAAGVVIGDKPLNEYLPLYKGKNDEIVTQFDMKMVEKVGLIKFDFLGLKTMTVVEDALELIRKQGKEAPDLDALSLDDKPTYELYSQGDTDGIFQVESAGMRKYLRQLKPTCFDDVIAMLALYRPGPLGSGMVDEFIKRKHGELAVTYPLPQLEDSLKDTYGVIVYQEQVMKIAQVVAKYTLGGADLLRRAMGKKNAAAMAAERVRFVEGAKENGIDKAKADEIFDLMEKFAEYGFNKSHSAAYALISYYTAYLKTHHPTEFMAALLTSELSNQDKVLKYIFACRDMSIEVTPPSVNLSEEAFTVVDGKAVFGLGGVKNVGREAIGEIVAHRKESGPYVSLLDLCVRVHLRKVTKRVLEMLIKCGALDCMGVPRASLFAALDSAVSRAQKKAKEKDSGQMSLFSLVKAEAPALPGIGFTCEEEKIPEWPEDEKSRYEKEALGFFLTSHPLSPCRSKIRRLQLATLEDASEMYDNAEIKLALIVTDKKERLNKKNEKWAICQVEDLTGRMELLVFAKVYQDMKPLLDADQPLCVSARVKVEQGDAEDGARQVKLLADSAVLLADVKEPEDLAVEIAVQAAWLENGGMESFKELLAEHRGRSPVHLLLDMGEQRCDLLLGPNFTVAAGPDFDAAFADWAKNAREITHA